MIQEYIFYSSQNTYLYVLIYALYHKNTYLAILLAILAKHKWMIE